MDVVDVLEAHGRQDILTPRILEKMRSANEFAWEKIVQQHATQAIATLHRVLAGVGLWA